MRWRFGLGSPPLVYLDDSYGYAFKPSQNLHRFGKRVYYSREGLRSEELKDGVVRVLCVGDSVTNGGAMTDQAATYPYRLEDRLRRKGLNVQVLNQSAGGWALGNELNYLKRHGIYGARVVLLEVGSDDFSQATALSSSVKGSLDFPTDAPPSATYELAARYLYPRIRAGLGRNTPPAANPSQQDNPAESRRILGEMVHYILAQGSRPVVMVMPRTREAAAGVYEVDHSRTLSEACQSPECQSVDGMAELHAAFGAGFQPFRDAVHPNEIGNQIMAAVASQPVMTALAETSKAN